MKLDHVSSNHILDEFTYSYIDHRGDPFSMNFLDTSLEHPFFSDFVQRLLDKLRPSESSPRINGRISLPNPGSGLEKELEKELCISNFVVCLIRIPDGSYYFGTNGIQNKQHFCTTDLLDLNHYGPCKSETGCKQEGHGEMIALANFFIGNGYMTQEQYLSIMQKRADGSPSGIIDHILMIEFIENNNLVGLFSGLDVKVYLQGHSKCCPECAEAMYKLGVREVYSSIASHQKEKDNRREVHKRYFEVNPDVKIGIDTYLSVAAEA